ncbi:malate dehydrogenase (quinone) [Mannheimia sp. AT1]|uniref:Probable malate:quinone oxidoreductase n=1 Tax=Mannheimia cairinae TaxID=3025936 RepID=A0ABT5MRI2_9PAST|nr:malate dehydrogenase (quinone) [Mannheimia cairinae]MDD0824076.1 malate dehydrogenase (quinone) [Mannheimia cairinae]MDD0827192.1 malate dehydrogenase (quinone) [Mannheimia cairinae]
MGKAVYRSDVALIGAGIMSATLGTFLTELAPYKSITIFEKQPDIGLENTNGWNNSGTGHSAFCELNYTPENIDGSIDVGTALNINKKFQLSLEMWAYLIEQGRISSPEDFIHRLPHISFVKGEKNVHFLKQRFSTLLKEPAFTNMLYSEDPTTLAEWMPLIMSKQDTSEPIAATYVPNGTDVNFGALSRKLFDYLQQEGVELKLNHKVKDIQKIVGGWRISITNAKGQDITHFCKFLFIGCGGGSLPLLQKTGIPESKHLASFPMSSLFMVCHNPEIIAQHHAKVYGRSNTNTSQISVPHLDTRFIDGKKYLFFGPFSGFTMKFLKSGSIFDLAKSLNPHNFVEVHWAGIKNLPLAHYLIKQTFLTKEQRMNELRHFIPQAKSEDWDIVTAGNQVQIIKNTPNEKAKRCFGAEPIISEDGSIATLLGSSFGASASVAEVLNILSKCFSDEFSQWQEKLNEMLPSQANLFTNRAELENYYIKINNILKL